MSMTLARERVFEQYKRRYIPIVTLGSVALVLTTHLLILLLEPVVGTIGALAVAAGFLGLVLDRLLLAGNRWLRKRLAQRLERLGESLGPGRPRFVGLAHPCYLGHVGRRLGESDDDVGFLTITRDGLHYHGDSLEFVIAADAIVDVRLVGSLQAPWRRVQLSISDGEPFDQLILDSRDHGSHWLCRHDNHELVKELRSLMTRPRERVRLTGDALAEDGLKRLV